jgi:hypothetical protein
MAMKNVGLKLYNEAGDAPGDAQIVGMREPMHRQSGDAERDRGRKIVKDPLGVDPAGRRIDDEADVRAGFGLSAGKIDDMAKQAADRRAHHMQDAQAFRVFECRRRLIFAARGHPGPFSAKKFARAP